jgi:hypothetical protein
MPTTASSALGKSAAMNRTPLSRRCRRNDALRDSLCSLAMIKRAPLTLARRIARRSSGRSLRLPLSTSLISSNSRCSQQGPAQPRAVLPSLGLSGLGAAWKFGSTPRTCRPSLPTQQQRTTQLSMSHGDSPCRRSIVGNLAAVLNDLGINRRMSTALSRLAASFDRPTFLGGCGSAHPAPAGSNPGTPPAQRNRWVPSARTVLLTDPRCGGSVMETVGRRAFECHGEVLIRSLHSPFFDRSSIFVLVSDLEKRQRRQ